jgi:photosystem II stability/assembly factor-like uncharacterized protein
MLGLVALVLSGVVSGQELEHCRMGGVLFTSSDDGFAFDQCGSLFTTNNGGVSWVQAPKPIKKTASQFGASLSAGAVFPDGSVVLGGYLGARLLRSADSGRTWQDVPIPGDQMVYSLSQSGSSAWLCGSSGKVVRTLDSGKSWSAAATSPTNDDDRCISLSFLDGKRGWVAGWYGHLYETSDEGATWTALTLPPVFKATAPNRTIEHVFRVDAQVGFVSGEPGTFRTSDGGKTWTKLEGPSSDSELRAVTTPDGRRLLVSARSATLAARDWEPALSLHGVARGKATVASDDELIHYYQPDGKWRIGRLTGATRGMNTLRHVRSAGPRQQSNFEGNRAFFSEDLGESWFELGALPGDLPFEELAFLSSRTAIARAKGASYFRSENSGRNWSATKNPKIDAFDLARAIDANAEEPVPCLSEPTGELKLQFGARGCFGGNESSLHLVWNQKGGTLRFEGATRSLTAEQAKAQLGQLGELIRRREEPSDCESTTGYFVTLDVRCHVDGKANSNVVELESYDCNSSEGLAKGVGGATEWGGARGGYARAIGVNNWASALLAPK